MHYWQRLTSVQNGKLMLRPFSKGQQRSFPGFVHDDQMGSERLCYELRRTQLSINSVSFNTGTTELLRNVNLSLSASGITAIMGFNGAGKSVLLKIMHGILQPTSGQVLWDQHPSDQEHRLSQAMVFQKPVLLRRSTQANIDFVLKQRNTKNPKLRNELLSRVGLLAKARQPARLLSGGEQQRLTLARALACSPSVLFLDEATASLDPASTAIIERIVSEQANLGTKIIMVTHDAAQAARLAQQIVFMDSGTVVEQSCSNSFFNGPQSAAARAYLEGRIYKSDTHEQEQ